MKWLAAILIGGQALAASASPIEGRWRHVKMIVRDQELPPRDPNLELTFEFFPDAQSRLYWTRDEGRSFCERRGQYSYDGRLLTERIVWVNPANRADCAQDPDMQLDRQTSTPVDVREDELRLHLPFGGEELVYVFARQR